MDRVVEWQVAGIGSDGIEGGLHEVGCGGSGWREWGDEFQHDQLRADANGDGSFVGLAAGELPDG